jgi:DNA-binding beta-propeller fold protein YncE
MRYCCEPLEARRMLSASTPPSAIAAFYPLTPFAFALPAAPVAPAVSASQSGAIALVLRWKPQLNIREYRIKFIGGVYNSVSKTIKTNGTAASATLTNLLPFTLYSIDVTATNSLGRSTTTHLNTWTAAHSMQKRYLYLFELPKNKQGFTTIKPQIQVFDINAGHKWVKNIPLPSGIYGMRGVAASAATGRAYFTFYNTPTDTYQTGGMVCVDMNTNKVLWLRRYDQSIVPSPDRFDITPDGSKIYMPVGENGPDNFWRVIDGKTGNPVGKIPFVTAPHNTIVSLDGKRAFLEGQEKGIQPSQWNHRIGVVDTTTDKLIKTIGPFRDVVRPFTINGKGSLVFATVNNFVGFQIGDVATGKVTHTIAPPNYVQPAIKGALSHGIALTPDEKQLWVVDGVKVGLHVWDVSQLPKQPPKYLGFVKTRNTGRNLAGLKDSAARNDASGVPAWIAVSYDGKYIYPESGEIIDAATRKVVGQLRAGSTAPYSHSRFMLEVDFINGKLTRTTDQFGVGLVR